MQRVVKELFKLKDINTPAMIYTEVWRKGTLNYIIVDCGVNIVGYGCV